MEQELRLLGSSVSGERGPKKWRREGRREGGVVQDHPAGLWETGFGEVGVSFSNGMEWAQNTRLERCWFCEKARGAATMRFGYPAVTGGSSLCADSEGR